MSFRENFSLGLKSYGEAHRFIARHKLWLYVLIPGIINIILFLVSWKAIMSFSTEAVDYVLGLVGLGGEQEGFFSWIKGIVYFFVSFGLKLLFVLLYFSLYKYIILIIMSPVLALLSEKVDEIITGNRYPFDLPRLLKDIGRGIMIALRNLFAELFFTILFWIGSFIPIVGMAAPVGMFLVQSYYYGFSMLDYSNERRRLGVAESIRYINLHKGLAIANGAVFYLLFLIPFIGWMIAPAYGVVAATLAVIKASELEKLQMTVSTPQSF